MNVNNDMCCKKFIEYRKVKGEIFDKFEDVDTETIKDIFSIKYLRFLNCNKNSINFNMGKKIKIKYEKDDSYFYTLLRDYLVKLCEVLEIDYDFKKSPDTIFCIFDIYIDKNILSIVLI